MITANCPDADNEALERRILTELQQAAHLIAPPVQPLDLASLGAAILPTVPYSLKMRLRAIPVLGAILGEINGARRLMMRKLRDIPALAYGLGWIKSLLLVHETRRAASAAAWEIGIQRQQLQYHISQSTDQMNALHTQLGAAQQQLNELREDIIGEKKAAAAIRAEILFQQRRLTAYLEAMQPLPAMPSAIKSHSDNGDGALRSDALDSYYAAFEMAFRGDREEIRGRLEFYLERVKSGLQGLPVLDIGCGRGEWIELLRDHGVAVYGIDMNSMFVADARESGLDVRQSEALEHLYGVGDASLAGITGFHIIEHLEIAHVIRILDEANRVLAPGGFLLLETPNPENLIVGASSFWNDPTHRAPLPPSVMRFMIEQRGFLNPEVIYLHPSAEKLRLEGDDMISQRLNQLLYGAQDYAIWARKA